MIKCANCESKADYTNADPGVNPVNYCASCLPSWLRQRASEGHFPLMEPVIKAPAAVKKKPAKSTK